MKKIITLISVLLVCITTFGQFPQNPTQGQTQIKQTNLGAIEAQRGLKAGQFVDTSAANDVLYMKGVAGILIYTTSDNNYWYRSADTMRWELIATTTSNCAGTQLISGSITWSGSGLVYDATDLDYYILCSRYFANSTTLTLAVADPTFARIDKFYADNTGNIGVITGTPSANPQEPQTNPLSQLDMGFVYIPAGSTVPAGTTQTVIYNENVEWSGTSDVPSINFAYATNPYIGSLSTYIPNAPNSSYVEWQSGGIDYLFSEAQYLKFWVRLNADFTVDPLSFLDVTFEYTDVTVSQTLAVGNGDYNMDYSLINQWQLVSIPLTGITTYGTDFNSVHFVINSAPTSFQLDYIYLLETATVPPVIGNYWGFQGNSVSSITNPRLGTTSDNDLTIIAGDSVGIVVPSRGVTESSDTTHKQLLWDSTTKKLYWGYQPTILADAPLYIYTDANNKRHIADTSATAGGNCGLISGGEVTLIDSTTFNVSAALYCIGNVNYSSLDSVMTLATPGDTVRIDVIGVDTSGSVFKLTGVEAENPSPPSVDATYQLVLSFVLVSTDSITPYNPQLSWSTSGNLWTNSSNFIGTKDNVSLRFRVNNVNAGQLNVTNFSTGFGVETLNSNLGARNNAFGWNAGFSNTTGTDNNSHGHASLYSNQTGNANNAYGYSSLYLNTGSENNAFGYRALAQSVSGTMNTAMGDSALITITTGSRNTAIGANADVATSSTDSSVAIGYLAVAATKQLAFSPHLTTMFLDLDSASGTAPAIAGIDANGNWRKYATPSGGSSLLPTIGTGTATGNIIGDLNGYQLDINNASDWNIRSTGGMGIYAEDAAGSFGMTRLGGLGSPEVQMTNTILGSGEASDITFSGSLNLSASHSSGSDSRITINPENIVVKPPLGLFYIDTLASGAGTKALKYNPSTGAVTSSDTLAVSGVYAPLASPTFTGTVTIPTLSISTTISGAGTWTAGAINTASNVSAYNGLFGGGVRTGNNTNIYWNSGPAMLGNTNDLTIKNAAATAGANVSIGTSAAVASAQFEITSTTKGFLPPRMTATQGSAISSPAEGLLIYVTDTNGTFTAKGWWGYNGAAWEKLNN